VSAYTCNPSYLRGRAEKIMVWGHPIKKN
jgi:hypothetical protein